MPPLHSSPNLSHPFTTTLPVTNYSTTTHTSSTLSPDAIVPLPLWWIFVIFALLILALLILICCLCICCKRCCERCCERCCKGCLIGCCIGCYKVCCKGNKKKPQREQEEAAEQEQEEQEEVNRKNTIALVQPAVANVSYGSTKQHRGQLHHIATLSEFKRAYNSAQGLQARRLDPYVKVYTEDRPRFSWKEERSAPRSSSSVFSSSSSYSCPLCGGFH